MSDSSKKKLPTLAAPGDTIVGSYNQLGENIKPTTIAGTAEDIQEIRQTLVNYNQNMNGAMQKTPTETKRKKSFKPKAKKQKTELLLYDEIWNQNDTTALPPYEPVTTSVVKEILPLYEEEKKEQLRIQFSNSFGRIKMFVEAVLECPMALCLIFSSEDDIIFTPKPNETLTFIRENGIEFQVYYPDALFKWLDSEKYVMILFKISDE